MVSKSFLLISKFHFPPVRSELESKECLSRVKSVFPSIGGEGEIQVIACGQLKWYISYVLNGSVIKRFLVKFA